MRLTEMKPGDRIYFDGETETVHSVTPLDRVDEHGRPLYRLSFVDREGCWPDGAWVIGDCPDGEWAAPERGKR
jgi:hypothetical protein